MTNWHDFVQHCLACFPEEACGVVVAGKFVALDNISTTPETDFLIASGAAASCWDDIEYVIHSHTQAGADNYDPRSPSKQDMQAQRATDKPWAIVFTDGLHVTTPIYFGDPKNRPPLLEREFVFNAQDCLTLTADYLYSEHGIELPVLPRDWDWFSNGQHLIDEHWHAWGFREVTFAEGRAGDLVLFRMGTRFVNHMGIYLGNNKLLHHQIGKLSCEDDLSRYLKYIDKILRHEDIQ